MPSRQAVRQYSLTARETLSAHPRPTDNQVVIPSSDGPADLDDVASDATIVFHRPVDDPVQILPGRLQVVSGGERVAGEDLRLFSKLGEPARVMVGREAGPAHSHITLHSPTVSRQHACLDYTDGKWSITNLSATNPVLVNERVLRNGSSTRPLSNGDLIELGDVTLRFLAS